METTGEKLKLLRTKLGLTQSAVAEALGVERSTYTYYELGKTIPSWDILKKLAKLFNISYYDLLEDQGKYILQDSQISFPRMNIGELNANEKQLILLFRSVSDEKQKEIINIIEEQIKKL